MKPFLTHFKCGLTAVEMMGPLKELSDHFADQVLLLTSRFAV